MLSQILGFLFKLRICSCNFFDKGFSEIIQGRNENCNNYVSGFRHGSFGCEFFCLERINFRLEIWRGEAESGVVSGDQGVLDQEHLNDVTRGPAKQRQLERQNLSEKGSSLLINPKLRF